MPKNPDEPNTTRSGRKNTAPATYRDARPYNRLPTAGLGPAENQQPDIAEHVGDPMVLGDTEWPTDHSQPGLGTEHGSTYNAEQSLIVRQGAGDIQPYHVDPSQVDISANGQLTRAQPSDQFLQNDAAAQQPGPSRYITQQQATDFVSGIANHALDGRQVALNQQAQQIAAGTAQDVVFHTFNNIAPELDDHLRSQIEALDPDLRRYVGGLAVAATAAAAVQHTNYVQAQIAETGQQQRLTLGSTGAEQVLAINNAGQAQTLTLDTHVQNLQGQFQEQSQAGERDVVQTGQAQAQTLQNRYQGFERQLRQQSLTAHRQLGQAAQSHSETLYTELNETQINIANALDTILKRSKGELQQENTAAKNDLQQAAQTHNQNLDSQANDATETIRQVGHEGSRGLNTQFRDLQGQLRQQSETVQEQLQLASQTNDQERRSYSNNVLETVEQADRVNVRRIVSEIEGGNQIEGSNQHIKREEDPTMPTNADMDARMARIERLLEVVALSNNRTEEPRTPSLTSPLPLREPTPPISHEVAPIDSHSGENERLEKLERLMASALQSTSNMREPTAPSLTVSAPLREPPPGNDATLTMPRSVNREVKLALPFEESEEAKSYGAFGKGGKNWVAKAGVDLRNVDKWIAPSARAELAGIDTKATIAKEDVRIAVRWNETAIPKARGAEYVAKGVWIAPKGTNLVDFKPSLTPSFQLDNKDLMTSINKTLEAVEKVRYSSNDRDASAVEPRRRFDQSRHNVAGR